MPGEQEGLKQCGGGWKEEAAPDGYPEKSSVHGPDGLCTASHSRRWYSFIVTP
jgi:hypothetical protein